jgi:flagellar biosynthesis protein FliR
MPFELLATYLKLPVFALVAARLGGLLLFQPLLAALAVPHYLRLLLVLGLAGLVTPFVALPAGAPDTPLGLALALGTEILLGALLGFVTIAAFVGLQMGGLLLAQESGIAFGQIVDPTSEEQETVFGVFYLQFAAVLYLIIGGHRALLGACLDTFATIPLLTGAGSTSLGTEVICRALALSANVALRVAGPTLLTLFLVNVALGFVSRTMPQLNVLAVGFSLKSLLAFLLIAVSLPAAGDAFITAFAEAMEWVSVLTGP